MIALALALVVAAVGAWAGGVVAVAAALVVGYVAGVYWAAHVVGRGLRAELRHGRMTREQADRILGTIGDGQS